MEAEAREHAARDAQPVRAAHRREGDHGTGRKRSRRRCRRERRPVRHRRRDRQGALARSFRRRAQSTAAREQHPVSVRTHGHADAGPGLTGEIHRLCRLVGRPAAADQRGRRDRGGAGREVRAGRRQAVCPQSLQGRHLPRDRAGLRRPDQRVLRVRSCFEALDGIPSRRRRSVGPPRRVDLARGHGVYRHRRRRVRSGNRRSATASWP